MPAQITLQSRYTKDLSFENPGAPDSFGGAPPNIAISVEVGGRHRENLHEIVLTLNATASCDDKISFIAEVHYAGLFEIEADAALRERFIYFDAPRMLFPFAERVLADAVRDGGLPPISLPPPDFSALYRQKTGNGGDPAAASPAESPAKSGEISPKKISNSAP